MKPKIIIDTDPGHDDAMALMLAVKSRRFNILAVTTVAGNSTVENTTRNARYILDLLGKNNLPVYSGADKPLKRDLILANVHGKSGLDGIDPTNQIKLTNDASEKIISLVKQNPGEITLVTLGPLTNIAKAIEKDPRTMAKLKQIVMMGGAIRVPGNKNRVAEFNIFVDPEAADIVFKFPVKKTIVPLDACNQVTMTIKSFRQIKNKTLREALLKMVVPFARNIGRFEGTKAVFMYDILTVFSLLKPKAIKTAGYNLEIETQGELTRGMTVADLRKIKERQANVTVVENIPKLAFTKYFINTLNNKL